MLYTQVHSRVCELDWTGGKLLTPSRRKLPENSLLSANASLVMMLTGALTAKRNRVLLKVAPRGHEILTRARHLERDGGEEGHVVACDLQSHH